jgi:trk system potassium uptake protein TrkA
MKIVVAGIGEIGYYLSDILLKEGHDLVLIDKSEAKLRYMSERIDAQMTLGNSASALTLEPIVDESTDIFVAVTDSDETNVVSTLIARRFGAQRAIVRITDPSNLIHPLLTDDPKVSVLNPEMIVSKDLSRLVGNPYADAIEFFAHGKAEMLKLHIGESAPIVSKKLKDIEVPHSWLFIAKVRDGDFSIVSGETAFEAGDQAVLMGSPEKSKEIESLLGLHAAKVKRVVLVGYNEISSNLAQALRKRNIEVRLIEEDKERAELASANLDDVLVIQGDGSSEEILDQAGVDQTDYLLALTNDDESNVMISLLAKEKKVKRVMALSSKKQYKSIIEKIGIDTVLNPRAAMVDEIIRCIHHEQLSGINIFEGGVGRMIEFVVRKKTKHVDVPLSKVKLPKYILIGAMVRHEQLIIPRG